MQHMHVNQSSLEQAVFKVTTSRFDASMKTVRHCLTAVSITHWPSSSHADTMHSRSSYKVKITQWKSFLSKLCVVSAEQQTV